MGKIINRSKAKAIAHESGIQIGDDALVLLDAAAEKTIRLGSARAKSLGRKRIDEDLLRGTLPGQ